MIFIYIKKNRSLRYTTNNTKFDIAQDLRKSPDKLRTSEKSSFNKNYDLLWRKPF